MQLSHWLGLMCLISTASSLVLNVPQDISSPTTDRISDLLPIQIVPNPTHLPAHDPWDSQTPATLNETDLTYVTYQCDGDRYGHPLAVSCYEGLQWIPSGTGHIIFRDRASRGGEVPLPERIMSLDGKCVFEISHDPGGIVEDYSSGPQLGEAASRLVSGCVQTLGQGGQAKGMGRLGSLTLSVQPYEPNVVCTPPAFSVPNYIKCRHALQDMYADTAPTVFGSRGTPGVQVPLPFAFGELSYECAVEVDIRGPPLTTNWYRIWSAAVAALYMCIPKQQDGHAIIQDGGSIITVTLRKWHE